MANTVTDGTNGRQEPPSEPRLRLTLGRDLVALGFVVVIASLGLSLLFFTTAAEVAAAVAPITTLVGTLFGTIFGVQAVTQSQAGQAEAAQQTTNNAIKMAVQAAAMVDDKDKQQQLLEEIQRVGGNSTSNGNPRIVEAF